MKLKNQIISYIQITLLLLAVIFGSILYNEPNDTLRAAHRSVGLLGGVAGVIVLIMNRKVSGRMAKITGSLAVVATFVAGYAGSSLKTTDNYDQMFNLMRGMGVLALLLSITSLAVMARYSRRMKHYSARPDDNQ